MGYLYLLINASTYRRVVGYRRSEHRKSMTSLQLYAAATTNPNLMQSLTLNTNRSLKRQVLFTKKQCPVCNTGGFKGWGDKAPELGQQVPGEVTWRF